MPGKIDFEIKPGQHDFYFEDWPQQWILNYEKFIDYYDL